MRIREFGCGLIFTVIVLYTGASAQPTRLDSTTYQTQSDILYYEPVATEPDAYIEERCKLDLYYPENISGYPTVVWFHGGGLRAGNKFIPQPLKNKNMAIAAVNYRLYPKITSPAYIEDAAAAVAWVFRKIHTYGGNPDLIFVSGHSAGGYLTSMIGLDKKWLGKHAIDANMIAGLVPFSGHTITHFTVREERGIPRERPVIDALAPLYHLRPDAPPLILITGDRNLELLGRYEENAYLMRMMMFVGHKNTALYELQGFDHGGMVNPAYLILLQHIQYAQEEQR